MTQTKPERKRHLITMHLFLMIFFSPVFSGLFDFCSIYTGASLEGAVRLNQGVCVPCSFGMLNKVY